MHHTPPIRRRKAYEDGYMLVSVIILLAIFLIAMAVGAPKVAESIQRDREVETMHRGKQYIRAIQLYYRKFHAYPPNLDALVKTNEIRFLRKKYLDPMTGKDDWKPVFYCQNKTPMAMGFFGQPLGGTGCGALAGIGPSGGNGTQGANLLSTSATGGGLFSPTAGAAGSTTAPAAGTGSSDTPVDANGTPINNTGAPLGNGQTFGGGGIIGVEPPVPKQSILLYKKKNHFNEWEFLYSPLQDQQIMAGGNAGNLGGQQTNGAPGVNQPGVGTNPTSPNPTGINNGPTNGTPPIQPPEQPPLTAPQQ